MAGVEFSELYKHHRGICSWSAEGDLLAVAVDNRFVVRDAETMKILNLYTCSDTIDHIEWACDGKYILAAMYSRALVEVWSLEDPEWTCRIKEGLAGLVHARWAPDGRHILTVADFNLHLTVWSLTDETMVYVKHPKHPRGGIAFSPDGRFVAVATREDCKDAVSVFACGGAWERLHTFAPGTRDLAHLSWSPAGNALCIRDTALEYLAVFAAPTGTVLSRLRAYEHQLGLKCSAWAPAGDLVALGSYDQAVRVVSSLLWRAVATLQHASPVTTAGVVVYREVYAGEGPDGGGAGGGDGGGGGRRSGPEATAPTKYRVEALPATVPEVRVASGAANPRLGVGIVTWNAAGTLLATRNDNMPTAVWVWDARRGRLVAVVIHKSRVRTCAWDPRGGDRLAIATGNSRLYLWTPQGGSWVDIPAQKFLVRGVTWNPTASAVLLTSQDRLCCCYFPEDEENEEEGTGEDDSTRTRSLGMDAVADA